jgi:hypothetical protein
MHSQSFLAMALRRFVQARQRIRDTDERAGHRNGARPHRQPFDLQALRARAHLRMRGDQGSLVLFGQADALA